MSSHIETPLLRIVSRKITREFAWTAANLAMMTAGMTAWIIIPSIGYSLESSLGTYGNNVATYIVVNNSGQGTYPLPDNLTKSVKLVPGVETVYPVATNETWFVYKNVTEIGNGGPHTFPGEITGYLSAVIGGAKGYPVELVPLSSGRLPNSDGEFISTGLPLELLSNTSPSNPPKPGSIGSIFHVFLGADPDRPVGNFSAILVGIEKVNPILSMNVQILWNSSLIEQKLGPVAYGQTFGQTNLLIIKVDSVSHVKSVANQTQRLLSSYPPLQGYRASYDETAIDNFLSVQSGTAPLYQILGIVSLLSATSVVVLITYLSFGKRKWEIGLFVTQGWTWGKVSKYYLSYFMSLALIAYTISVVLSFVLSRFAIYNYQLFASQLTVVASPQPVFLVSALPLALVISSMGPYLLVRKSRRVGLDNILREI